jgi:hypothetical protein
MRFKNVVKAMALFIFVIPALAGCGQTSQTSEGGSSSAVTGKEETFSYWLGTGELGNYFSGYADNPVMRYLTNYKTWGSNKTKLKFDFQIPATGTQSDACTTMISSGQYTDIIDLSYYKGKESMEALLNDGVILDLTEYVNKYMPHYLAWLDKHPLYAKTAVDYVNGEKKYLELYSYSDSVDPFWGFQYRRDWLAKYGTNPKTGVAFKGAYDENGSWSDDIVFPNGGTDPIYISDWEWMFDIFSKALIGEGVSDGYCMSLYYPGYNPNGDFISAFGGGGPLFYNDNGTACFGYDTDTTRTYYKCINAWYKNGWIDKKFAEHTNELFYQTDTTKVHSGKVACWYGQTASLYKSLDISEGQPNSPENGYTNGICVYGARQPINDIYGSDAQKNKTPFTFYYPSLEGTSTVITTAAKDKDLEALFSYLDYMYSDQGALLHSIGLSKEQYEECQDPIYTKLGLTDGAYTVVDANGNPWVEGTSTGSKKYKYAKLVSDDLIVQGTVKNMRVVGRSYDLANDWYRTEPSQYLHSLAEWRIYPERGTFLSSMTGQMSSDDNKAYSSLNNNLNNFINKYGPTLVTGKTDPNSDTAWNSYITSVEKYGTEKVRVIFQNLLDKFYK